MKSSWIDRFTRGFFWFGFCVFLGASIPHIATYYRHFDPNATGVEDIKYWVISYLIAIVIDVTDVLVSIAVMKAISHGTKKRHLIAYWVFIFFVMALSWLINWQYNVVFETNTFATADKIWIVGQINPIIGSAFQLFILVYTGMAHKFAEKPVAKTADQLKQEADELEQLAKHQARIDAVKRTQNANKVDGLFDSLGQAKQRAKTLLSTNQNQAIDPPIDEKKDAQNQAENVDQNADQNAGQNEPIDEPIDHGISEPISGETIALSDDVFAVLKAYPKMEPLLSTGRPTFKIAEVSEATGYGERMLAKRIEKGEIKVAPRGDKLILKSSLLTWLKTAPAVRQNDKIVVFNRERNRA